MMTVFGPLLASMFLAQVPVDRPRVGSVVDGQGKPIAGAQIVFYAPPVVYGNGDPIEVGTRTDAAGKFSLKVPPIRRIGISGINFFAFSPGWTITAHPYGRPPIRLVLEKPVPRTVKVLGPDGQPLAGARLTPRLLNVFNKTIGSVPPSVAELLATTTGADGTSTLSFLGPRDQLAAVRVSTDLVGTQDILLIEQPGRGSQEAVITIGLKKTTHLGGRLVDPAGQPVTDHPVKVWSRGGGGWLGPNTVLFKDGLVRTGADGSFQTPDNLMVGSTYRVAVVEPGDEPILSDWITISDQPKPLPEMVLRPLRSVTGRVVDRQGKPASNFEVFQSGDGPERTSARTDTDGRFSLGGFRQGTVFLFAHGDGFRFHGQMVKPNESTATVELTRTSEQPTRQMKMLPELIPIEESQALARRLVEPLWNLTDRETNVNARYTILSSLAAIDPARVLTKLESVKLGKDRLQREIALALAPIDFEEATTVAESISTPAIRASTLIALADRLSTSDRARKLDLLDRAVLQAKITSEQGDRLFQMGEVAERQYELGEVDRAKALFAEGAQIAGQFTDKTAYRRGLFGARIARVDLPAALAIAKGFDGSTVQGRVLGALAFRLIETDPKEAERLWARTGMISRPISMYPTLCWKMATVDPSRARSCIESLPGIESMPELYLFLALGSKTRDPSASRSAFETGIQKLDRLVQGSPERYQIDAGKLLPIVERIDPTLVPEVFWLDVSSRMPVGNPRTLETDLPIRLVTHLAWYDREVAAALFERDRAHLDQLTGGEPTNPFYEFQAWLQLDPRAAVASLEKLPIGREVTSDIARTRLSIAEFLAKTQENRWRTLWGDWDMILGGTKRDF
jgi:hypothetical protein